MEFTKDALQLIQQTAQQAIEPKILQIDDPRKAYVQQGAELREVPIPPPVRDHHVSALGDLIAYARTAKKPVVWHDANTVTLVIDDDDRRDTCTMRLYHSEPFERLMGLRQLTWMNHVDFLRLLRIGLAVDATVVAPFRQLQWNLAQKGSSEVQRGRESLGRDIEQQISGVDDLPEELRIDVPVYSNPGERTQYVVVCSIETDAKNQQLALIPLVGQIEQVVDLAQQSIRERLSDCLEGVPIYYGRP